MDLIKQHPTSAAAQEESIMATNADWVRIAGTATVHIAPVGTTLPTGPVAALDAAFDDVGYTTEDGIVVSFAREVGDHRAHQSAGEVIRREVLTRTRTFGFEMMEFNEHTIALGWEGTAEATTGGAKIVLPDSGDPLVEYAAVIDVVDGDETLRFVVPRGSSSEDVDTTFAREAPGILPVTLAAVKPTSGASVIPYYTDAAALGVGS